MNGITREECWVCNKIKHYDHENDENDEMTLLAEGYVCWNCFDKAQEIRDKKSGYTKGKWRTYTNKNENSYFVITNGKPIRKQDCIASYIRKKDAQLIASAPDLLEACKEAQRIISIARKYFPRSIKNNDTFDLNNTSANTIQQAINKAEGK